MHKQKVTKLGSLKLHLPKSDKMGQRGYIFTLQGGIGCYIRFHSEQHCLDSTILL